jgi:hypothetical protein
MGNAGGKIAANGQFGKSFPRIPLDLENLRRYDPVRGNWVRLCGVDGGNFQDVAEGIPPEIGLAARLDLEQYR